MALPNNVKDNSKDFQVISKILDEFRGYIKDHRAELEDWLIDTDCLDWHIDCVEMCADRIAHRLICKGK